MTKLPHIDRRAMIGTFGFGVAGIALAGTAGAATSKPVRSSALIDEMKKKIAADSKIKTTGFTLLSITTSLAHVTGFSPDNAEMAIIFSSGGFALDLPAGHREARAFHGIFQFALQKGMMAKGFKAYLRGFGAVLPGSYGTLHLAIGEAAQLHSFAGKDPTDADFSIELNGAFAKPIDNGEVPVFVALSAMNPTGAHGGNIQLDSLDIALETA